MRSTLIALVLLLFFIPTASQADEGVAVTTVLAEGIMLHGEVLHTELRYVDTGTSDPTRAFELLVRVKPDGKLIRNYVGMWRCTHKTRNDPNTDTDPEASLECISIKDGKFD